MTDIYDDLEHFDFSEELGKLKNEKAKLQERVLDLEKENASLTQKCSFLEIKFNTVNENISSLLKTSKAEIERKDRTISDLRRQLDDFAFRRQRKFVPNVLRRDIDESKVEKQAGNETNVAHEQHLGIEPPNVSDHFNKLGSYSKKDEQKCEAVRETSERQRENFKDYNERFNEPSLIPRTGLQLFNPFSNDKIEERRIRLTQLEFEKDYLEAETMLSTERQQLHRTLSPRVSKRNMSPFSRQSNTFDAKCFKQRDLRSPDKPFRNHRSPGNYRKSSPHRRKSRSPFRRRSKSNHRRKSRSPLRRCSRSPDNKKSRSPHGKYSRSPHRNRTYSPHRRKHHDVHSRRSPYERYSRSNQRDQARGVSGSYSIVDQYRSSNSPKESYKLNESSKYRENQVKESKSQLTCVDVKQTSTKKCNEDKHHLQREGTGDDANKLPENSHAVPVNDKISLPSDESMSEVPVEENKKSLNESSSSASAPRVVSKMKKAKLEFSFTDESISKDQNVSKSVSIAMDDNCNKSTVDTSKPLKEEKKKKSDRSDDTKILNKTNELEKSVENKGLEVETVVKGSPVETELERNNVINKPKKQSDVDMLHGSVNKKVDENKEPTNKMNVSGVDIVNKPKASEMMKRVNIVEEGAEKTDNVLHMKIVRRKTIIKK